MKDAQLNEKLSKWAIDIGPAGPLNSVDLAARVRTLKTTREQRHRTMILASAVVFVSIFISASFFSVRKTQNMNTASLDVSNDSLKETAVNSDSELTEGRQKLSADLEQTQFKLQLLAMNIRVQQEIAKADRLLLECDLQESQENQAAQWLAATLQATPVGGIEK